MGIFFGLRRLGWSPLRALQYRQQTSSGSSTIDLATAPPLAPLAPVDLSNRTEIAGVLAIAAKIGEILITGGTPNSDAQEQVRGVTRAFGVYNCQVDFMHQRIRLYCPMHGEPGVATVRIISPAPQNFRKLSQVDRLIREIQSGKAGPADAELRVDAIANAPEPMGLLGSMASWATMSLGVSTLLGGNLFVQSISTLTAFLVIGLAAMLGKAGLPVFFQNVGGGIFVSLVAMSSYHLGRLVDLTLQPSMVIATSIVVMLAGLTLLQTFQNGVTSAPITATARLFDTLMITGGVVAGVGIGIALSSAVGFDLPPMQTLPAPNFASSTVRTLGGVVATMGFSRACYAAWDTVIIAGITALWGSIVFYFILLPLGADEILATAGTSVAIGLTGGILARRYQIPPLIIAIAGLTPLLPGLAVYRGLYGLLHEQLVAGFSGLTYAIVTCTVLAAGSVFGEWLARLLRKPANLEAYVLFPKLMASAKPKQRAART